MRKTTPLTSTLLGRTGAWTGRRHFPHTILKAPIRAVPGMAVLIHPGGPAALFDALLG